MLREEFRLSGGMGTIHHNLVKDEQNAIGTKPYFIMRAFLHD
jgi:hypothetical protein